MRLPLIVASALLLSCAREAPPPIGQLVLHVDTDAPLDTAPDGNGASSIGLFDTLRIEIFRDGHAIDGVSREFGVHEALFRQGRASVGIVAAPGDGRLSARVRLFRYVRQVAGEPQATTTLETNVKLPAVVDGQVQHVVVFLHTDDVGRAVGYPEPDAASPFTGGPSLVGTWSHGGRVDCSGEPREGEVCVPGGAFWFGGGETVASSDLYDVRKERLTVVAPFFIDATETTLSRFAGEHGSGVGCSSLPEESVNCVSWQAARAACIARGMELPSEAQWEWVASGSGSELDWPWGNEPPSCGDANIGGFGCGADQVLPPGRYPRDQVIPRKGGPAIRDLAGNVAEWALDAWVDPTSPPWSGSGVLIDPVATDAGDTLLHALRGAYFGSALAGTAVWRRMPSEEAGNMAGFRCVRPAR